MSTATKAYFGLTQEQSETQAALMMQAKEDIAHIKSANPDGYQLTSEYIQATHSAGMGGSDMAPILGVSEYTTKYHLWSEKTGRTPPKESTFAMRFGHHLEDFVAQEYSRLTGNRCVPWQTMDLASIGMPYLISNYDRVLVDNEGRIIGGLEIKTCSFNSDTLRPGDNKLTKKWGNGNAYDADGKLIEVDSTIDPLYVPQVQFYLYTSQLPFWDVAVLIGGGQGDLRIFRVFPDKAYQEQMIMAAIDFWRHVLDDVPPEQGFADARLAPTDPHAGTLDAQPDLITACAEYRSINGQIKLLEKQLDAKKDIIAGIIGAREKATYVDPTGKTKTLLTFKAQHRQSFDAKAFEQDHPDLYKSYLHDTTTARYLRVY